MNSGQVRFSMKMICIVAVYLALVTGMAVGPAFAQNVSEDPRGASEPSMGSPANPSPLVNSSNTSSAEILKELAEMRARIAELEAQLRAQQGLDTPALVNAATTNASALAADTSPAALNTAKASQTGAQPSQPRKEEPSAPFSYADWTWLNGNPRTKDAVWDSKFFT